RGESSGPLAGSAGASGCPRACNAAGGERNLTQQPAQSLGHVRRASPAEVAAPRALPGRRDAAAGPEENPLLTTREAFHGEPLHEPADRQEGTCGTSLERVSYSPRAAARSSSQLHSLIRARSYSAPRDSSMASIASQPGYRTGSTPRLTRS